MRVGDFLDSVNCGACWLYSGVKWCDIGAAWGGTAGSVAWLGGGRYDLVEVARVLTSLATGTGWVVC